MADVELGSQLREGIRRCGADQVQPDLVGVVQQVALEVTRDLTSLTRRTVGVR